jgi:hypothetical protein
VSGDPGRIAGSQERDCSGDVLGLADASERVELAKAIRTACYSVPVPGPDGGWRDRIHPNAIWSQTGGEVILSEPIHRFGQRALLV